MNTQSAGSGLAIQIVEPGSDDSLMSFVMNSIDAVDWPNKQKIFKLNNQSGFTSVHLMILEVYCYARGAFESSKVAELCRQEPFFADLFPVEFPTEKVIRRFRRYHHEPIKACLLKIFDIAFRVRFGSDQTDEAPVDYCVIRRLDEWFEPMCGPHPAIEAEERIDQAIFFDGMAASGN